MKDIKQIQQYNRQKIICAAHGTEDYEKALRRDVDSYQCYINSKITNTGWIHFRDIELGKPLDLARVLLALKNQKWWRFTHPLVLGFDGAFCEIWQGDNGVNFSEKFHWNLTKPTLELQDYEAQVAIYRLLGGE